MNKTVGQDVDSAKYPFLSPCSPILFSDLSAQERASINSRVVPCFFLKERGKGGGKRRVGGRGEEDENFVEKLIGEASKNFMGADTGICRLECLSFSREESF